MEILAINEYPYTLVVLVNLCLMVGLIIREFNSNEEVTLHNKTVSGEQNLLARNRNVVEQSKTIIRQKN